MLRPICDKEYIIHQTIILFQTFIDTAQVSNELLFGHLFDGFASARLVQIRVEHDHRIGDDVNRVRITEWTKWSMMIILPKCLDKYIH